MVPAALGWRMTYALKTLPAALSPLKKLGCDLQGVIPFRAGPVSSPTT
jgi:hypothetical protein